MAQLITRSGWDKGSGMLLTGGANRIPACHILDFNGLVGFSFGERS